MLGEGINSGSGKITKRVADQLPVVMFPKVSVSALTRHVKHCEGKTTHAGQKTENLFKVNNIQVYLFKCHCSSR